MFHTHTCAVGEEDEVSIKEAADAVVKTLGFKGEVVVSFYPLKLAHDEVNECAKD